MRERKGSTVAHDFERRQLQPIKYSIRYNIFLPVSICLQASLVYCPVFAQERFGTTPALIQTEEREGLTLAQKKQKVLIMLKVARLIKPHRKKGICQNIDTYSEEVIDKIIVILRRPKKNEPEVIRELRQRWKNENRSIEALDCKNWKMC